MVFTNEPTMEACKAALGYSEKMCVIPHLVDIARFYAGSAWRSKDADAPFVLYYIGGFHKGIREPGRLFVLIRQLNKQGRRKYLLRIYGPLNNFRKEELSPSDCLEISYLGPIERPKAIEALKMADAIVNVDNENCIMTPSKIVECLATGRPLVNIAREETHYPPLQAYESMGFAVSVPEGEVTEAVAQKVRDFLEAGIRSGTASLNIVQKVLAPHALETIEAGYRSLCRGRG
ncbi:MAG: hypothetical protein KGI97_05485, partial [Alphaproteobacteria bacterium]|nr:hypothetical protein [Alphaproteobacteria bacterium]